MIDKLIDKHLDKLSSYPPSIIITFATILVVLSSVPLVYILTTLFGAEYTNTIFIMSIVAPLLMVPITVAIIIKLSVHLKYFKDDLYKEIENNKKKDIILFEQARFVLMGEMMANISHQWKQPLNTINLSLLDAKFSGKDDLERHFDIIEDNVKYLASTIDDFMSFFDKKTHIEIRSLSCAVQELKSIIEAHIANKDITLQINIHPSAKDIHIASSISQVILNLLSNAKDSFTPEIKDKTITVTFEAKDDMLKIRCCNNGKKIPEDIKDKIFNPYFTTKERSKGTGLGLYMSKQITQKLFAGDIDIAKRENCTTGCDNLTCFFIDIPYTDKCMLKRAG